MYSCQWPVAQGMEGFVEEVGAVIVVVVESLKDDAKWPVEV